MSNNLRGIIVLMGLLVLMLTGWNLKYTHSSLAGIQFNNVEPTYRGEYITTVGYNIEGEINYKLMANNLSYYIEQQITWFNQPITTMFDKNKMPIWTVKADEAKLTKDKILYLYGHVQVDSLSDYFYIKHITTDNAVVNLITQDVFSDDKVTLYSTNFNSTGMKMRGNLRNKIAELIENVNTFYEVQKLQRTP